MRTVFLDNQSSTPVLPEAFEAMRPFCLTEYGNPASLHRFGMHAREALSKARSQFSALLHAPSPEAILFTSGATEAANLAVKGVAYANQGRGKHLVISATEHPAVRNSVEFLEAQGFTCTRVPVDREGLIDPDAVRHALRDDTILICVHHANHETGAIQPIRDIAAAGEARGIPLFVDATATAGWLKIDVEELGVDLLSLSPHRFYGPKGTGALYRSRRVRLTALIHGGDQETGRRAGTENVPGLVGAGVAAEVAGRDLEVRQAHTAGLQRRLWENLATTVDYLALNGPKPGAQRLSTNLNISAEFTEGEGQLLALDMAGIAVASGAACVSKAVRLSPVLQAMGVDPTLARASIILSLGKDNTQEEIDYTVATFSKVVDRLRGMSPSWDEFRSGLIDSVVRPKEKQASLARARPFTN